VHLDHRDVRNVRALFQTMILHQAMPLANPTQQIWPMLSENYRAAVDEFLELAGKESVDPAIIGQILAELPNQLDFILANPDMYKAEAWEGTQIDDEAQALLDRGIKKLEPREVRRLNRLLLTAAYPDSIEPATDKDYEIGVFGKGFDVPMDRAGVVNMITTWIANFLVGIFGVLVAILFTSTMVPRMFEAGSIDLLLSKPVSRSGIVLGIYLGGCAFITIVTMYFIGGLFLLIGIRMGHWEPRLLLTIPVFVLTFAVYYAVSAFVGVLWRSAILSIAATILFWGMCFGVGFVHDKGGGLIFLAEKPSNIVIAEDEVFRVLPTGVVQRWSEKAWPVSFHDPDIPLTFGPLSGPFYDADNKRLVGMYRFDKKISFGPAADDFNRQPGPDLPGGAGYVTVAKGRVLAFNMNTVSELSGETFLAAGTFDVIGPFKFAVEGDSGDLIVYDGFRLFRMTRNVEGAYVEAAAIEVEKRGMGVVAYGKDQILLAYEDGTVHRFDEKLAELGELELDSGPRRVLASPDGRTFMAQLHNQTLWMTDTSGAAFTKAKVKGQGSITAIGYGDDGS
jgi:hypothetical protein